MNILPLKPKSKEVLKCKGFLTVLEGSVRSSKSLTANWYFINYIIDSPDRNFLLIGATLGSLKRNVVESELGLNDLSNNALTEKTDSQGYKYLSFKGSDKRIYMFGGEKANSYKAFRGITAGGVYVDEASLCHQNTIAEVFNRTIASNDRRHIFTLNPDIPTHWLYTDYLDKYKENKTKGYNWFHFDLDDNPVLSEERKEELKGEYTGIFYKRFILGLRVRAEGGCYPSYRENINVINKVPDNAKLLYCNIGVDIGGSMSATTYTLDGFYKIDNKMVLIVLDEFYDNKNYDAETVINNYKKFVIKCKQQYHQVMDCYIDSAEQLFKKSFTNLGMVNVRNARKGSIVDRIKFLDLQFARERAFIMRRCTNTIIAVETAVWDKKADKETRLDDGVQNVDSLDSMEYGFEKAMRDFEV